MSSFVDPIAVRGSEKITYTPNTCSLVLSRNETPLWRRSAHHALIGMLQLEKDETVQQAAKPVCTPNAEFFTNIRLPKFLAMLPADHPPGCHGSLSLGSNKENRRHNK